MFRCSGRTRWADLAPRKQATKKKNKTGAKDQTALTSRDPAPKPAAISRKSSEATVKPAIPAPAPQPIIEEPHVPMNDFNASEVEAMLSSGAADKGEIYKSDKPTLKAGGVWGAKRETRHALW